MIDNNQLPSWREIFQRIGEPEPRRGRARCPIHNGDSRSSLSVNEDKGVYYCHVCHSGGDKIAFIQQLHRCSFNDALHFLGVAPGKSLAIDPSIVRRQKIREGLRQRAHTLQRGFRDEFYFRSKIAYFGRQRLLEDPEDSIGWDLLQIAYRGTPLGELERLLDLLIGTEAQQLEAYRQVRGTA